MPRPTATSSLRISCSAGITSTGCSMPTDTDRRIPLSTSSAPGTCSIGPGARRRALRDAVGASDLEWLRGAAWALEQAMGVVWYYRESLPAMSALGRTTLLRLLEDPEL